MFLLISGLLWSPGAMRKHSSLDYYMKQYDAKELKRAPQIHKITLENVDCSSKETWPCFWLLLCRSPVQVWSLCSVGRLTGAVGALCVWVEREVELLSEESSVVCVDQLKHALMDDVRLEAGSRNIFLTTRINLKTFLWHKRLLFTSSALSFFNLLKYFQLSLFLHFINCTYNPSSFFLVQCPISPLLVPSSFPTVLLCLWFFHFVCFVYFFHSLYIASWYFCSCFVSSLLVSPISFMISHHCENSFTTFLSLCSLFSSSLVGFVVGLCLLTVYLFCMNLCSFLCFSVLSLNNKQKIVKTKTQKL